MNSPPSPRFTIVTVCRNAEELISATAASLQGQHCKDYEWLVIDGASTDSTCQRVKDAGVSGLRLISEPDAGIYDAMNKAVRLAVGGWVYFLNAGDELSDPDVLGDVAGAIDHSPGLRLLWGDVRYVSPQGSSHVRRFAHVNGHWLKFEDLNHQGVFARRSLFEQIGPFETRFRTSADYDWLLRVFRADVPRRYLHREVASFLTGGAHARDPRALVAERERIRLQYCQPLELRAGLFVARVRRRWRLWMGRGG